MPAEIQTILMSILPSALMFTMAVYNLIIPRLPLKEVLVIWVLSTAGMFAAEFVSAPLILVFLAAIFVCLYRKHRSTPGILFVPVFGYLIGVLCDNFLSLTVNFISGTPVQLLQQQWGYHLLFTFLELALTCIVTYLLGRPLTKVLLKMDSTLPGIILLFIFAHLCLCCAIIMLTMYAGKQIGYGIRHLVYICILDVIFFSLSLFITWQILKMYHEKITAKEREKQYAQLKEYTENLEQVYHELRSFKHDYVNIMSSISSYLEEQKMEELSDYFYGNILPLAKEINRDSESLNKLMNIRQLEIKSLLSYKMMYALGKNIAVTIDIPDVIEYVPMPPMELVRILGIYLDNAIEAALETSQPEISLHMAKTEDGVAFLLSNSFLDRKIPLAKLSAPGITTKGGGHGYGLYHADQILSKYDRLFHETYTENHFFFQHIRFPG